MAKKLLPAALKQRIRRSRISGTLATRTGEASSPHPPQVPAAHHEEKLWLGYTRAALEALESVWSDTAKGIEERSAAALAIGKWHLHTGRFGDSESWLGHAREGNRGIEAASLLADCLLARGRPREALATLAPFVDRRRPDASTRIRIGVARSASTPHIDHGSGALVEALNNLYAESGLASIIRKDVDRPPRHSNLQGIAPRRTGPADIPLVSVIIHCQGSDPPAVALQSLVAQSWEKLEILLVHEGDARDECPQSRSDPRLRRIRADGVGQYAAWNTGKHHARGELLLLHDAREWSHPQRIEIMARKLVNTEHAGVGTFTLSVDEDFHHRYPTERPQSCLTHRSFSSLMIRRSVTERIGGWDEVFGPADEEYAHRITAVYGEPAFAWVEDGLPLSIQGPGVPGTSVEEGALGFDRQYREAFEWWHQCPNFESELPLSLAKVRPFTVPEHLQMTTEERVKQFGTVILGDLGSANETTTAVVNWALQQPGWLGVGHIPGYNEKSLPIHPEIRSLLHQHAVTFVSPSSSFTTEQLVMTESVLSSPPFDRLPNITTNGKVLAVGEHEPPERYRTVAHLQSHFGREVEMFDIVSLTSPGREVRPE